MIMTATSAAMGIIFTHPPNTTIKISRKTPATKVESRPRPPDFTLMTVCPIIAQPAMPPKNPETIFATPGRRIHGFLLLSVSVRSSTIEAVMTDSSKPTTHSGSA
jgi:hypothetical protein